jgi:hypothetical protein
MSQGHSATPDIDLAGIQIQFPVYSDGRDRKRFIDFEKVDVS